MCFLLLCHITKRGECRVFISSEYIYLYGLIVQLPRRIRAIRRPFNTNKTQAEPLSSIHKLIYLYSIYYEPRNVMSERIIYPEN